MKQVFGFLWRFKIYVIIVLIIGGIISYSSYKKAHSGAPLTFDKVTLTTVTDAVSESGNLQTEGQANISSPIEGIVSQIFVANGDRVGRDQALFSIQSTASDMEKAAAYAGLLSAQTNTSSANQTDLALGAALDSAKSQLYSAQNNYSTVDKGYHHNITNPLTGKPYKYLELQSAKSALDAAEANLKVAEAKYADAGKTIDSAQAALDSAQLNFDSKSTFTVKASSNGIVSNISINPGDKVSPTAQTGVIPMIISRANAQNILEFKTQINENDIAKLKVDQDANISVDAVKNKTFKAKINSIDLIGTNTSGVITYNVYFTLSDTDDTLRPGMSGSVDVIVTSHENALTVANAAIKPYQGGKAVQVVDTTQPAKNGQPALKYIPVTTGIKTTDRTEILSGLAEGTDVVINNTANQFKSSLFGG